jgi:hypothetical protein
MVRIIRMVVTAPTIPQQQLVRSDHHGSGAFRWQQQQWQQQQPYRCRKPWYFTYSDSIGPILRGPRRRHADPCATLAAACKLSDAVDGAIDQVVWIYLSVGRNTRPLSANTDVALANMPTETGVRIWCRK